MKPAGLLIGRYAALGLMAVVLGLPFYWMVLTSLKPLDEVLRYPPAWTIQSFQWENYVHAWQTAPFGRFYVNSLLTGMAATGLQIGFALAMAYAFVWIPFPAKRQLFILVLATMMIPEEMRLAPNYLLLSRLGWRDTYWALILPTAAHAFPVFVLYQQFRMLPNDLIEAARIDGAGHGRTLVQVIMPISRPLLVAVTLVSFLGRWNDFLWPLIITDSLSMRTLPIGLAYLRDVETGTPHWNLLMAGSVSVVAPVLMGYAILQRQFVSGLTHGALKG